jgi:predicted ArsR family transcriptional regulator
MEMMSRRMPAATHDTGMNRAFDRWSKDLEQKILDLLDKKGSTGPSEIAAALGIPEDVAVSLLHRLALEGKVRIGSVEKSK